MSRCPNKNVRRYIILLRAFITESLDSFVETVINSTNGFKTVQAIFLYGAQEHMLCEQTLNLSL